MAKIERFEDIQAWQEARELTKTIEETSFNSLYESRDKVVRLLGGFIRYLSGKKDI